MTFEEAKRIKDRHEDRLLGLDCVQGVGLGENRGQPVITVYVDTAQAKQEAAIPGSLDDVPVVIERSGVFEAL